jgi:hypothetical protein
VSAELRIAKIPTGTPIQTSAFALADEEDGEEEGIVMMAIVKYKEWKRRIG